MIALVNWQYIILRWPSNGVYRVKKRMDGPPPVVDSGTVSGDSDSWNKPAESFVMYNNDKYDFAFWSITAQDMLSPQREAHINGINASSNHPGPANMGGGMWIITAKAYYVRDVGLGGGPNGLFIDAFDIQEGDFIADDFVDVTPDDAIKTLTTSANNGFIDTSGQIIPGVAEKITARDALPSGKIFAYWEDVPDLLFSFTQATPATVGAPGNHDIVVHQNDIVYAFAYYNETAPILRTHPRHYEIYDPWWWIKTHGGLTGPEPIGPEPWLTQFAAALALAAGANRVSPQLRNSVLQIALKELAIASGKIKNEIKNQGK